MDLRISRKSGNTKSDARPAMDALIPELTFAGTTDAR